MIRLAIAVEVSSPIVGRRLVCAQDPVREATEETVRSLLSLILFRSVAAETIQVLPVSEPQAAANAQYLITAILHSPLCFSLFFVSSPGHEKPPSEGGETRKQRLRDGLGRYLLLLEVVGNGFSAL